MKQTMKFTTEMRGYLLAYLAGDGPTPSGQNCRFLKFYGTGIKFYGQDEHNATFAFDMQKSAAGFGLAPQVGEKFLVSLRLAPHNHINLYGYTTEIADEAGKDISRCSDEFYALQREMLNRGFSVEDLYGKNMGRVQDKLVCIDFDPASQ